MRPWLFLLGMTWLLNAMNAQQPKPQQPVGNSFSCPVTLPYGQQERLKLPGGNYGNEFLATALWSDGNVIFKPGGSGSVLEDGALAMKFPWFWRTVEGKLTLEGRRLDAPARPLRAFINVNQAYGHGFQPSSLIFPNPGCWEVTGRVGNVTLTFVTRVVKIGDGPTRASH